MSKDLNEGREQAMCCVGKELHCRLSHQLVQRPEARTLGGGRGAEHRECRGEGGQSSQEPDGGKGSQYHR